jgi:omega-6 fatty acid desaturase (delta-12 desaturase)
LLVPYYSWQISHGKHHHHTGHLQKDQVFVPPRRSQLGLPQPKSEAEYATIMSYKTENDDPYNYGFEEEDEEPLYKQAPLFLGLQVLLMWTVGWPGYLIANMSGQSYEKWTNHFDPSSPIFEPKQASKIVASDLGVLTTLAAMSWFGTSYGWLAVWKYYFAPYLVCNAWLVTITFLQHTHPVIPHYNHTSWTFVRGALSTIDRDYGVFLNHVFHGITNTHVAHHLFSQMPHYHAWEATEILEKVLVPGELYYKEEKMGVLQSVWSSWWTCRFVEDKGDVLFWRK